MNITDILHSMDPYLRILLLGSLLLFILVILVFTRLMSTVGKILDNTGYDYLIVKARYAVTFLMMVLASVFIIVLLKILLASGINILNFILFAALPYSALVILLIGTIYRYRKTGFQVSSLSSQFLEGKKLFWGSQPFHWGILVLFMGHLIAFLFPSVILAWNGRPVRLLILEGTAFAFGLLTLWGLIMLIGRRLNTRRILMVSNKMDMLVYVILLVQVMSGLGVAFFLRWGSSWFASVLAPYLISIFLFNPKIDAIGAMPWLIQIHIIFAFVMFAIIPFTRFVHFLVAPFDYIWRSYQQVIWNWNRKLIRNSAAYYPGKKSRNN